jgi:hypothetical protein
VDYLRREIDKLRGVQQSILLADGSRVKLPNPPGTAQGEVFSHMIACVQADYARERRPAPKQWHYAVADAADRLSAVRLFNSDYAYDVVGDEGRHVGGPYCLDCLVLEGVLRDISMADSSAEEDLRPIPHDSVEPIPWEDPHAFYKEVTA